MAGIKDAVNNLKTVEGTLANNKVANFCYTDNAYTNNQANGVSDYDYEREQNIPVASTEVLKTNETVFLKGFRSQASSITRMLLNHFFGRVSYNLNKTADVLNGLLTNLYSYLGTANGIATLDANGRVPASQLPETAMEFKGTWNCATNTTSTSINLINGQGTKGDLYLCSVEGWFNASTGTGSATKPSPDTGYVQYFVNDRIVYDGSTWNRLSSGDIQRVNGLSPTDGNVQITRRVTQAQYNALTSAEKEGHIFIITDVNMNDLYVINDAVTASDSVWSSQKTFASISVVSATSKTITGTAIANGSVVRVFFEADITASDTSTALQITYNGTVYNVKVPKDGALQNYVAFEVSSGVFKYLQAYTTLELLFDGTQFVIIGNPVVISNSNYAIYADGSNSNKVFNTLIPINFDYASTGGTEWTSYKKLGEGFLQKYNDCPNIPGKTKKCRLFINAYTAVNNGISVALKKRDESEVVIIDNIVVWGGYEIYQYSNLLSAQIDPSFLSPYTNIEFKSSDADYVAISFIFAEVYYE